MAEPAQRQRARTDAPPVDPQAVDRAYRFYRASGTPRSNIGGRRRMAHVRFWAFLGILLLACAVVAVTVWGEVARIFGI